MALGEAVLFILAALTTVGIVFGLFQWICWEVRPLSRSRQLLSAFCYAIKPPNPSKDEIDGLVHLQTMDRKVRHFRAVMRFFSFFGIFWNATFMAQTLARDVLEDFTTAQAVSMLLAHSVLAVTGSCPWLITHRTLDVFYSLLVLANAGIVSPWAVSATSGPKLAPIIGVNALMVLLNGARRTVPGRRLPVFGIMNLLFYVSSASSIHLYGESITSQPLILAGFQLLTGAACCVCLALLESSSRNVTKQHMELQEVRELLEASCKLLRSCCQVVVETDACGVITSEDTDLSSFLLRGGGQKSLKGTHFADLLVEDQDLFLARLQEMKLQQTGLAESMPVSMRDGCGNVLRLSLLWLQFKRSEGQRIMMGIRELGELPEYPGTAMGRECIREVPVAPGTPTPGALAPCLAAEDLRSDAEVAIPVPRPDQAGLPLTGSSLSCHRVRRQRSSSRSSRSSSLPDDAGAYGARSSFDDTGALLVVDSSIPDMPVRLVSSGFSVRADQLPLNAPLASFVLEPLKFQDWLQTSLNLITYDLQTSGDVFVHLKFGRRRLKAGCRIITFTQGLGTHGAPLDPRHVGLFFFDVKRLRHARKEASGADAIIKL